MKNKASKSKNGLKSVDKIVGIKVHTSTFRELLKTPPPFLGLRFRRTWKCDSNALWLTASENLKIGWCGVLRNEGGVLNNSLAVGGGTGERISWWYFFCYSSCNFILVNLSMAFLEPESPQEVNSWAYAIFCCYVYDTK